MLASGDDYDGRYDIVASYKTMQSAEKLPLPFPSVILANRVFVRPLISQDLGAFVSTFKSKYLRRRMGFPVSDKSMNDMLNEFFLSVLSSYKSISLTFLFMVADIDTFDPIGILSFHPMGIVLSDVPFVEGKASVSNDAGNGQFTNQGDASLAAGGVVATSLPTQIQTPAHGAGSSIPVSVSVPGPAGAGAAAAQGAIQLEEPITPALIDLSPDAPCVEVIITFDHGYRRHGYDRDVIEAVTRYCLRHGCVPLFANHPVTDSRKAAQKTVVTMFQTKITCRLEDIKAPLYLAYISPEKQ